MISHDYLKESIKGYLLRAQDYTWTLQGFGMLRLHLTDEFRLNIWDSNFRVPDVTLTHTHPWDFESVIIAGIVNNVIFEETDDTEMSCPYHRALIQPGMGGGIDANTIKPVNLCYASFSTYSEGQVYSQTANMIHVSDPVDGSITYNRRHRIGEDKAFVYWAGKEFVTAEPRIATQEEVSTITKRSLNLWF